MAQNGFVDIVANFETQIAGASIAVGDSTATLLSETDKDGDTLPDGTWGFTLDQGETTEEHIVATKTGTALSDVNTIDRYTGQATANFAFKHRRGASIKVTNFVQLRRIMDVLDGTTDWDADTPIKYDANVTHTTGSDELATVKWVEDYFLARQSGYGNNTMLQTLDMNGNQIDMNTAKIVNLTDGTAAQDAVTVSQLAGSIAGAPPNASETVQGVVEIATSAEAAAGTDTGGTGATLVVKPSDLQTELTGVSSVLSIDSTQLTDTSIDYSHTLTGGTLGTTRGVKVTVVFSSISASAGNDFTIDFNYDNTTLVSMFGGFDTNTNGTVTGILTAYLIPGATSSAQKGFVRFDAANDTWDYTNNTGGAGTAVGIGLGSEYGTAAEDSSTDKDVQIVCTSVTGTSLTADFAIFELI